MNKNQPSTILLPDLKEPIRAELFSLERLEQHAESLAAAQTTTSKASRGRSLLPRVVDNGHVLLASYRAIAKTIQEADKTGKITFAQAYDRAMQENPVLYRKYLAEKES